MSRVLTRIISGLIVLVLIWSMVFIITCSVLYVFIPNKVDVIIIVGFLLSFITSSIGLILGLVKIIYPCDKISQFVCCNFFFIGLIMYFDLSFLWLILPSFIGYYYEDVVDVFWKAM